MRGPFVIDARETVPGGHNGSYRQSLGGSATLALAKWLRSLHRGSVLDCHVESELDSPQGAFDRYGRLVADVVVAGKNVGHWLVERGHAFPALYDSMSSSEREAILAAARVARRHADPVWRKYTAELRFDPGSVLEPRPGRGDDDARVVYPKLFRRLALCYATQGNMRHLGPFVAGRGDVVFRSPDLQHGQPLASLIDETRDPPRFTAQPEELVFKEAPSVLLGPKGALAADW